MSRYSKSKVPAREPDPARLRRLAGTRGANAIVGEVLDSENGLACWELNPAYAAWLWPLMLKATSLVLAVQESELEPLELGDTTDSPRAPTEEEKDKIFKLPERAKDSVRIYRLDLKGKSKIVYKAFPTRTANMRVLRFCRKRISSEFNPNC